MMAGRNISVSKMAFGSTRVMGTCAIGGQAVGTAAAMCIQYNCMPKGILSHMEELQQALLKDDCYIPGLQNMDEKDLARTAVVTASSAREGFGPEQVINGISRGEGPARNLWISDGKHTQEDPWISFELKEKSTVSQVRLTFDSNFHYPIKITLSAKRQKQQRIGVPIELVKNYTVTLWNGGEKAAKKTVSDNVQRVNAVDFLPTLCDRVTVTVHDTNGAEDVRIFEVRIYP